VAGLRALAIDYSRSGGAGGGPRASRIRIHEVISSQNERLIGVGAVIAVGAPQTRIVFRVLLLVVQSPADRRERSAYAAVARVVPTRNVEARLGS
jgi:hypothetical protein